MLNQMTQIQKLSDTTLLKQTKQLVRREHEILSEILHHLREIDRRKLYSELKFKSLYEYTVKELGYSEDQAYRRIDTMRLIKEVPALQEKIEKGSISLSTLGVASSLFKAEAKHKVPFSKAQKLEVLNAFENKSKREAEEIAGGFSTLPLENRVPEKLKTSIRGMELSMPINPEFLGKINRVKGLLAHSNPGLSTKDLFEKLCDKFIEDFERKLKLSPVRNLSPVVRLQDCKIPRHQEAMSQSSLF